MLPCCHALSGAWPDAGSAAAPRLACFLDASPCIPTLFVSCPPGCLASPCPASPAALGPTCLNHPPTVSTPLPPSSFSGFQSCSTSESEPGLFEVPVRRCPAALPVLLDCACCADALLPCCAACLVWLRRRADAWLGALASAHPCSTAAVMHCTANPPAQPLACPERTTLFWPWCRCGTSARRTARATPRACGAWTMWMGEGKDCAGAGAGLGRGIVLGLGSRACWRAWRRAPAGHALWVGGMRYGRGMRCERAAGRSPFSLECMAGPARRGLPLQTLLPPC